MFNAGHLTKWCPDHSGAKRCHKAVFDPAPAARRAARRTRRIANELARDGLTPLEVMIETMRELWHQAETASTPAERLQKQVAACAIAEMAAPYIHARLTAVSATVRQISGVRDLSDAELSALIQSLGGEVIDSPAEPMALTLTGATSTSRHRLVASGAGLDAGDRRRRNRRYLLCRIAESSRVTEQFIDPR